MDNIATEVLNSVESVADETIKVDSVAAPSKPVKKSKAVVKDCEVLYWNKDSRNIAFQYEDKKIQLVMPCLLDKCGSTVKVRYTDGKYEILER